MTEKMPTFLRKRRAAAALILALTFCTNSLAWQGRYSFEELEKRVLVENFRVRALQNRLTALSHEKAIAEARAWPRLTSFYRYNADNLSLTEDNFTSQHAMTLRISQDLIGLFGERSAWGRAIQDEADIMASQLQHSKKAALLQFREDYLDLLANRSQAEHYKALVMIYEKLRALHETRYRHQEGLLTDLLEVESELAEAEGWLAYHEARVAKQKSFLAAYFDLKPEEIAWNEITITPPALSEDEVLADAVQHNERIGLSLAKEQWEGSRRTSWAFEGLQLAPFVGLRWNRGRLADVGVRPEVGIRFSMPLGLFNRRSHLARRNSMRQTARQLEAKETAFDVKKQVALALDDYSLAKSRIAQTQKRIELNQERMRIERSKLEHAMRSVKADPVNLLELEGEAVKLEMRRQLYAYQQLRTYYRLRYLTGGLESESAPRQQAKIREAERSRYSKALWLWNPQHVLFTEAGGTDFLAFCRDRHVSKVFLSLNREVLSDLQQGTRVSDFVIRLHQANVQVSGLLGEPSWVRKSDRPKLLTKLRALLTYNGTATELAQFDAVHLDIEPHALPEWPDQKRSLLNQLVATVAEVQQVIRDQQPEMAIELDLPTFYHKIDRAALKELVALVDGVTVMAYERTDPAAVLRSAQELLKLCQMADTNCTVGLNVKDFESEWQLRNLIEKLAPMLSEMVPRPEFAIHDYHRYRDLVKETHEIEEHQKARK